MNEFDCRHFLGDKPCPFSGGTNCLTNLASGLTCRKYEGLSKKILIIKLGALGDVLRTTTLLPALRMKFPSASIAWITKTAALPLLKNIGLWKLLPWEFDSIIWAEHVNWDACICLDKEEGPTALAERVKASSKYGFGRNLHGLLRPLSKSSEYLFYLGIDDTEKFYKNNKTYPQLIAEACELEWGPNLYQVNITAEEKAWAKSISKSWGEGKKIGINVGSGEGFAGKKWPVENIVQLAKKIKAENMIPVFLGGAREKPDYLTIKTQAEDIGVFPGCEYSIREFIALVSELDVMVSGDTLAMHIAIATGVYTIALFGSTTAKEIDFYGKGEAIIGEAPCAPCYRRVCPTNEECMNNISVKRVFEAINRYCKSVGK